MSAVTPRAANGPLPHRFQQRTENRTVWWVTEPFVDPTTAAPLTGANLESLAGHFQIGVAIPPVRILSIIAIRVTVRPATVIPP